MVERRFRDDVYMLVASIPKGKVMTYGQIAAICSHPNAAKAVGQIAHFGPSNLPWHRVVNKKGAVASNFVPDGRQGQKILLEQEGVKIEDIKIVNFSEHLWQPKT